MSLGYNRSVKSLTLCTNFGCARQVVFELKDFRINKLGKLMNFQTKHYMFFWCLNSRSCDLGSPKLAHMTQSLIPTLIRNFNFLRFTVR